MKGLLLCAVLVVGMAGPAVGGATFKDGNKLLAHCQADDPGWLICDGYVKGISDALDGNPIDGFRACLPTGVIIGRQVKDIAIAWLKANPQYRHFSAATLVAEALSEAFPCKK